MMLVDIFYYNPIAMMGLITMVSGMVLIVVGSMKDDMLLRTSKFGLFLAFVGLGLLSIAMILNFGVFFHK